MASAFLVLCHVADFSSRVTTSSSSINIPRMRRLYLSVSFSSFPDFGSDGQRIPPHRPKSLLSNRSLHTTPRVDFLKLRPV